MAGSFTVDTKRVAKLAKELETVAKKALPYAVRNALNSTAFQARKEWIGEMHTRLTLRNKFTANSVRVEKASGTTVAVMQSSVGSVAPYMASTELGGQHSSKGKHGVPIPTTSAAGMSPAARPRTKQVLRRNWQSAINLPGKVTGSRSRRNAVALAMAAKTRGVAFLDLGKRKGLFRVTAGKKAGRMRIRMIWDMSKRAVVQKPRPTLEPTLQIITSMAPAIQEAALIEQFRRRKVVGY